MTEVRKTGSVKYPFTERQWEELQQQVLVLRYLVSGLSVPPHLISSLTTSPFTSSSSSFSSSLFHHHNPCPSGWGSFHVGINKRTADPEPGRCKRTDGKKWRCSKETFSDSKYCEKHMHRAKPKPKNKPFENSSNTSIIIPPMTQTNNSVSSSNAINPSQLLSHQIQTPSFYPFLSPFPSKQSSHSTSLPTQSDHTQSLSDSRRSMDSYLYFYG